MNKKIIPLVLLGLLTVGGLAGCGDNTTTTTPEPTVTPTTPDPTTPDPTTPEVTTPEVTTPTPTTPTPTTPTPTTPTPTTPVPVVKTIPYAAEGALEEKTLSYWAWEETVSVETIDNEDGTYEISYTSTDDSFYSDLQLYYKDSTLTGGQAYKLEWNVNSSAAGKITVNNNVVELVEGDNAISVKYVCAEDTAATTALHVYLGTANDGLLRAATLKFGLPSWTETSLHTYESANWTKVTMKEPGQTPGDGDYWWFEDEPTIRTKGNPIFHTNGIVSNTPVDANYDISVDLVGTQGSPAELNEQVGILAWYHDDNNYVISYGDWEKGVGREMRQFQTCAMIDGTRVWGDFWTDQGAWAPLQHALNQARTYRVEVRTAKSVLTVKFLVGEDLIGTKQYDIAHITEGNNYAGLYAAGNDTITFSNYTYTKVEVEVDDTEEEKPNHPYTIKRFNPDAPAAITYNNDGTYTIDAPASWESNLIVRDNKAAVGKFQMSTRITAQKGYPIEGEQQYGLVLYWDDQNFITVTAKYYGGTKTDRMIEILVMGFVGGAWTGWNDFWMLEDWHLAAAGVVADPALGFTLGIDYDNGKLKPSVDGVSCPSYDATGAGGWTDTIDLATEHPADIWTKQAKVGYFVLAGADNLVTVTEIKVINEDPLLVQHSYTAVEVAGMAPKLAYNTDGTFEITSQSAWENNFLVTEDANATGKFTMSADFKAQVGYPNDAERLYGFVLYWDSANFVKVFAKYVPTNPNRMTEIVIMGFVGGHDPEHWTGFHDVWMGDDWHLAQRGVEADPAKGFTLGLEYDNGVFRPTVDGVSCDSYHNGTGWSSYCDLASRFPSDIWTKECKIGYFISAGMDNLVTVSDIAVVKAAE